MELRTSRIRLRILTENDAEALVNAATEGAFGQRHCPQSAFGDAQ
jgi:hypothetical protein